MQLACALSIEHLLVERLLRLADVVQEVDVALLQPLSRLAEGTLLHPNLPKLGTQLTEARGLLLSNAELLRSKLPDSLSEALELLSLLAVDVGNLAAHRAVLLRLLAQEVGDVLGNACLLPCQCTLLRRKVSILLPSLQVLSCRLLAQSSLLNAELAKALPARNLLLRKVSKQPCPGLAKLCLLRRLLAVHTADALEELGLLRGLLLLRLLQLCKLHGSLGVEARLLEALRCSLQAELSLLAGKLAREPRLLCLQLCRLLPETA